MDGVKTFKAALSAIAAALTALWGWFGWLILAWMVCMALDIGTGMAAGAMRGEWSSGKAREGLFRKAGCVAAVTASGLLDLVAGMLLRSIPGQALPFSYTVFLCPMTVSWYLLTELGSIVENAGSMGAPIPAWLKKAIAVFRERMDDAMEK